MIRVPQGKTLLAAAAAAILLSAAATAAENAPLLPPNAKAGECYARVLLPAQYSTETAQALKREATEQVRVIPARYETVTEQVLVREASTRLEIVPAVYENVTEQVMVRPASKKIVEVPAKFRTVSEQVLDTPAQTIWKKGGIAASSGGKILKTSSSGETGEVLCLVEVPATYKTVTRTVVDTPASAREIEIPAEYTTVSKRVLKTPPTTREIAIPAEYKTVQVTKMVEPARTEKTTIPAEYQTVSSQKVVREPTLEWRQVLCDQNLDRTTVMAMQQKLQAKGFYNGPVDGVIGGMTMRAVNDYAGSSNLPTGSNFITMNVAKDLGVSM